MATFQDWDEFSLFDEVNLVVNGEFPNNIGNWRITKGEGDIYWEDGRLVFDSRDSSVASQSVILEDGKRYSFSADSFSEGVVGYIQLRIGGTYKSLGASSVSNFEFDGASPFQIILKTYGGDGRCSFDNIKLIPV